MHVGRSQATKTIYPVRQSAVAYLTGQTDSPKSRWGKEVKKSVESSRVKVEGKSRLNRLTVKRSKRTNRITN